MPVSKTAVAAMVGTAFASNLATIAPCTQKPGLYEDQVVTAQFQEVSYCVPTQTVEYSTTTSAGYGTTHTVTETITTTAYPLASTSVYVSTVIPCAYDGTTALSSCTVTTTDQNVECRETSTTITSYKPYETTVVIPITEGPGKYGYGNQTYGNGTYSTKTTTSTETHYTTVSKHYDAPYNQVGGWIIPGYGGASINKGDVADASGNKYQALNVTDCSKVDSGEYACTNYVETWTSKNVASSTSLYSSAVSTHAVAPTAGTYAYTFKQTAPAVTYTAPATGAYPSTVVTAPAQTWEATVTKSCTGKTTWDITTTISKTITYTCPYEHPTTTPAPTTTGGAYPTGGCKNEFKLAVVDSGARFQKSHFVGFDGEDAIVSDAGSGAVFNFDGETNLKAGSDYIATSGSSQYAPFEKSANKPGSYNKYTVDASGNLQLSGAKGFCQKDDAIFVVYGSAPYGCADVKLQKKDIAQAGCATTTYAPTTTYGSLTTSTTETSTYSTPDISADPTYEPTPIPTAAPTYGSYKKRYVIRSPAQ